MIAIGSKAIQSHYFSHSLLHVPVEAENTDITYTSNIRMYSCDFKIKDDKRLAPEENNV